LWELAGARIGVVAGAVGLLVALVGLPHTIREALGQSDSSASQLAAERTRAQAAGPRLEVRYLLLTSDLMRAYQLNGSKAQQSEAAGTLATAFPIVANEVMSRLDAIVNNQASCKYQDYPNVSIAFLELSNRGSRDATNIVVEADRLTLPVRVRVQETAAGGDDYVAKLRARASASAPVKVEIPRALGPGEGVRLPLFVSDAPADRYDRWCVLPGVAYLPKTVRFDDPAFATTTRSEVRRMKSPLVVARGAVERG
jgi:hypothetical protein